MKKIILLIGLIFSISANAKFSLRDQVDTYKQRYNLKNPYDKLIDNRGNGYEALYGIRNFRVVLHGIYYRGGANNIYNKYEPRDNKNPLPNMGLNNLCAEGFQESVYFYSTNFEQAQKISNCTNFSNVKQTLNYHQISILTTQDITPLLKNIFDRIKGYKEGPLYGHCWNGWHASGFAAAVALKQFCGWNDQEAEDYWVKNTDGDSNYESVRKKVRNFRPYTEFLITEIEKNLICP